MRLLPIRIAEDNNKRRIIVIPTGLNSEINLLVFAHLVFFLLYIAAEAVGLLEHPVSEGTVADFIRANLGLSYRIGELSSNWWISIFTFQFVHSDFLELMLSMGILWFFGHILKTHIGERKVVALYFACTVLSGIVFLASRLTFKIFSAGTGMMEGAFSGALGVMTAAVVFAGSSKWQVLGTRLIPLWHTSLIAVVLYLLFFYQHNMAYILVLACSIYTGYKYPLYRLRSNSSLGGIEAQPSSGARPLDNNPPGSLQRDL